MQPGKIEHEIRHGELAALHLVPHTPYYGTHDATSLYVLVAALAWRWHGDADELAAVRPHVERALEWIDRDGDIDGDGLQECPTPAPNGYYNQGWKDAKRRDPHGRRDARQAADRPVRAPGPRRRREARLGRCLSQRRSGRGGARRLRAEAERLAAQIEERFWWEKEGAYYLGLDGDKRPIRVRHFQSRAAAVAGRRRPGTRPRW